MPSAQRGLVNLLEMSKRLNYKNMNFFIKIFFSNFQIRERKYIFEEILLALKFSNVQMVGGTQILDLQVLISQR